MEKMFLVADHCFSIIGERALAALESLPGFAPFSVQNGLPEFSFMEGDDVPSLETSQYTFAHEGVEVTFGLHSEGHILQIAPLADCLFLKVCKTTAELRTGTLKSSIRIKSVKSCCIDCCKKKISKRCN